MGKTTKPLRIFVDPRIWGWPEIQALKAQEHDVVRGEWFENGEWNLAEFDLVLGPACHRMSEDERKWLDDALAEARKRAYPPGRP